MVLNEVNGTAPAIPFRLSKTTKNPLLNPGFTPARSRFVFEVVNSAPGTIPAYLKHYFGPSGWTCTGPAGPRLLRGLSLGQKTDMRYMTVTRASANPWGRR
jgi:hypothetical protein